MHRRDRAAEVGADGRGLARAPALALRDQLLERAAAHQLHPQADPAVDHLGAVERDDTGWRTRASARPSSMIERARARRPRSASAAQQLERDLAVEPRVPGAVDLAERAAADALEHGEVAPTRPRSLSSESIDNRRRLRGRHGTMEIGDGGEDFQPIEQ